jgi:hypothetical protein
LAAQREWASARFTFKMAVFWFTDHFFCNYWPQKSICLTKFLLNPNSSNINAIGVWCSLVQRALAHFQTFLLLKKIAELLDFVASFLKMIEKHKIADLSPKWTIFLGQKYFSSWPYLFFSVHHQLENVSFVVAISFR